MPSRPHRRRRAGPQSSRSRRASSPQAQQVLIAGAIGVALVATLITWNALRRKAADRRDAREASAPEGATGALAGRRADASTGSPRRVSEGGPLGGRYAAPRPDGTSELDGAPASPAGAREALSPSEAAPRDTPSTVAEGDVETGRDAEVEGDLDELLRELDSGYAVPERTEGHRPASSAPETGSDAADAGGTEGGDAESGAAPEAEEADRVADGSPARPPGAGEPEDDGGAPAAEPQAGPDWSLPRGGFGDYADALTRVGAKETTVEDLRVRLHVVPDAWLWTLARKTEELDRTGFGEDRIASRLRDLHRKHGSRRGQALFRISLEGKDRDTYFFLRKGARDHILIRQRRRKRTYSVVSADPRPRFRRWTIFIYPPDRTRRSPKVPLALVDELQLDLGTKSVDLSSNEPVTVILAGFFRARDTGNPRRGINSRLRQLSCTELEELLLREIEFKLYPGRWELPSVPKGLQRLDRQLEEG